MYRTSRSHAHRFLGRAHVPALLLVLALIAGGCSPDDPFVPTTTKPPVDQKKGAFLRVVVATPGIQPVDVFVDGTAFFLAPEGFLDFSATNNNAHYYPVDSNAKKIAFLAGSNGAPVASGDLKLTARRFYTAYLYGNATRGYNVLVTSDSIETSTVPGKSAKYRVVNLSPDAPAIDIRQDSATAPLVVTALGYGQASSYIASREYPPGKGTGLWVYDHATGTELRAITPPYIPLLPNSTFTLVLTGNSLPRGDDPFLNFAAFQENILSEDSLYGAAPFTINFTAVRFANLVASGDSLLDVTFYDPTSEFALNNNFRRNFIGQAQAVEGVASLGHAGQPAQRSYFYLSLLLRQDYPYRIEYHQPLAATSGYEADHRKQDIFLGRQELRPAVSKRYTIVAYGTYALDPAHSADGAHTVVLLDNTPAPPPGMVSVRFFHGAFGANEGKQLRLRIAGAVTPQGVGYGTATPSSNYLTTAPGSPTVEVIDEGGNVVASQDLTNTPLKADKAYTIFLTRGPYGDKLYLHALSEDFTP